MPRPKRQAAGSTRTFGSAGLAEKETVPQPGQVSVWQTDTAQKHDRQGKGARHCDETFLAYNWARLREACRLFTGKMLDEEVTVGMSFAGALTPAGMGCSSIVPLIKAGFVDWLVATGANLYHDMHFALNYPVRAGSFKFDDTDLRNNDIVRVYDVLLGYSDCLMATDEILRSILIQPEFQKEMGTAELHYLLGKYCAEWEDKAGLKNVRCWRLPIAPACPATRRRRGTRRSA